MSSPFSYAGPYCTSGADPFPTFSGGATAGTFTAGAAINITGNWTNDGATFIPGTNTITFNGANSQVINGTAASQTFYNITMLLNNNKSLSI